MEVLLFPISPRIYISPCSSSLEARSSKLSSFPTLHGPSVGGSAVSNACARHCATCGDYWRWTAHPRRWRWSRSGPRGRMAPASDTNALGAVDRPAQSRRLL